MCFMVSELYPTRYRALGMGLAVSSNCTWNSLFHFFTPFITPAVDYRYGYVFTTWTYARALVVYFGLCERKGKTLEEIDAVYILHVKP